MNRNYLKRKERIIITAIELLDEAGIQGLTTKEIAKRQGITEPAVYKQFESKRDIILTILERFAAYDEVLMNTIIEQKMQPDEGLNYFVQSLVGYYQGYSQITTVMFSFDVFRYEEDSYERMKKILGARRGFIAELIKEGQDKGLFSKEYDAYQTGDIILGIIWATVYQWKIGNSSFDLKDRVEDSIKRIMK